MKEATTIKTLSPRAEQILDEAIELLSTGGLPALTTKNLAKAVGVTEPALYRHFKNKMDILTGILNRQERNMQHLFDQIAKQHESPLDQIQQVYFRVFRSFSKKPAMAAVVFAEEIFRQDSGLSEQMNRILNTVENNILTLLKSDRGRTECRTDIPAKDLARIMMGASRLLVGRWRLSGYALNLNEEGTALWQSLRTIAAPQTRK